MSSVSVDKKQIQEVVYEHTDSYGNYTIEYYDWDGNLIAEQYNSDGSTSYRCSGG